MTHRWEEVALCDACYCAVVGCLVACAAALNLGQFVDAAAAAVVWAAAVVVSADVFVLVAAVAVALDAAVPTSRSCAVTSCLVVVPGPRSAAALVHVAG